MKNHSFYIHIEYEGGRLDNEGLPVLEDRYSSTIVYESSKHPHGRGGSLGSDPKVTTETMILIVGVALSSLAIVFVAVVLLMMRASRSSPEGSDMNPEYGTYNGTGDVVEVEDRNTEDYGDSGLKPKL